MPAIERHPSEIRIARDRSRLSITWDDGTTVDFPAALLRRRARDAGTVRLAADGCEPPVEAGLTITGAEPVGHYAIRLSFSDGHDRGIFPWSYLHDLAAAPPDAANG
jgi:DUF971 family protein